MLYIQFKKLMILLILHSAKIFGLFKALLLCRQNWRDSTDSLGKISVITATDEFITYGNVQGEL